jgi:hypothetical protein
MVLVDVKLNRLIQVPPSPIEVLRYATLHSYVKLLDTAAVVAIGRPLGSVAAGIPLSAVTAWVMVHSRHFVLL